MRARRSAAVALLAAGLVLSACGSAVENTTAPEQNPTTTQGGDDATTAPPGDAVMVPTADGSELDFNSLRGQDVMLWFWAPW